MLQAVDGISASPSASASVVSGSPSDLESEPPHAASERAAIVAKSSVSAHCDDVIARLRRGEVSSWLDARSVGATRPRPGRAPLMVRRRRMAIARTRFCGSCRTLGVRRAMRRAPRLIRWMKTKARGTVAYWLIGLVRSNVWRTTELAYSRCPRHFDVVADRCR